MIPHRKFRRHLISASALLAMAPAAFAVDYSFSAGAYSGPALLSGSDTLAISPGSYKYLNSDLFSNGTVTASDDLYFQYGHVLSNAGLFDWKNDSGFYDGGYNGGVVNTGTLRKSGGTGVSNVAITGFTNSGTIDTRTGTINFNAGAVFNAGSAFTGAGQTVVSSGATFNGAFSSQNLTLANGIYTGNNAVLSGAVNWTGGQMVGNWTVASGQALTLAAGGYKYLAGGLVNNGTVTATDNLYFQYGNVLANKGSLELKGDVGFYDGGYNGGVVNTGTLSKTAGTGTSFVSISGFSNSGTVEARTGTIEFNTGATFNDGTKFAGLGQVVVSSGATFAGTFTTSSNLTLTGGTYTGSAARIGGNTTMTGGYLTGDWQVASGQTLTLAGGGYKYLAGSLVNNGNLVATDTLYFQYGNTLTNNGSMAFKGDVGFADGGFNGGFVNNGTLVKSDGTGTSTIGIAGFVNNGSGVIDVRSGTMEFNAGAQFNSGTRFTGAGRVVVSGGANFAGDFSAAAKLAFTAGTFNGSVTQPANLQSGALAWTGGTLAGSWQTATGTTLNIDGGGYKYVTGSVTTGGHTLATDTVYLQYGNVLHNTGVYEVKADVGIADGGYNGQFVNSGTFLKSAGTGVTDVSSIAFSNTGTVDVRSGTILLPTAFVNAGTVTGTGALATNVFTNNGRVDPGIGASRLTLNGNFMQSAAGFMDIELASALSYDQFLVNGTAALHGGLSLACIATCDLHAGDIYTIFDATGELTGTFDSVTTAGFASGFAYSVVYDYADDLVKLMVLNAGAALPPADPGEPPIMAAVPEPGTWALMLCGLGVLGRLARRRPATA